MAKAPVSVSALPLETMRALAVLALVSYHVVGPNATSALELDYPHPLRMMSDFLVDIRMPAFAFLAGFIYALRPPELPHYLAFLNGKFWRIYVPGMIASALFLVVSHIMGTDFALPWAESWRILVQSYAHFWFLQAICAIFVIYGLFDAVVGGRFTIWVFVFAAGLFLTRIFPGLSVMSWNGVTYLFVYFMAGVTCWRALPQILRHWQIIALVAFAVLALCAAWNVRTLYDTGSFSSSKRDLQSLGFGLALCVFALLCLPRFPLLEKIRPYALTIYLYHIFGTSGMRRVLDTVDVDLIWLRWGAGMIAGIFLPVALHLAVSKVPVVSRYVLGR